MTACGGRLVFTQASQRVGAVQVDEYFCDACGRLVLASIAAGLESCPLPRAREAKPCPR